MTWEWSAPVTPETPELTEAVAHLGLHWHTTQASQGKGIGPRQVCQRRGNYPARRRVPAGDDANDGVSHAADRRRRYDEER